MVMKRDGEEFEDIGNDASFISIEDWNTTYIGPIMMSDRINSDKEFNRSDRINSDKEFGRSDRISSDKEFGRSDRVGLGKEFNKSGEVTFAGHYFMGERHGYGTEFRDG